MTLHYADKWLTVRHGDVRAELAELADESVHCVVTSPPYWGLRDYGQPGQLGLEPTPEQYVENMVAVFREVRRVLRSDGTLWLNLGDSYATGAGAVGERPGGGAQGDAWNGHRGSRGGSSKQPHTGNAIGPMTQPNRMPQAGLKPKDLVGIPWRVAFALQADGWYLRSDIIWSKPNPMPESVTDRPTKSHEYLFLLAKSARYYFDADAVREEPVIRHDPAFVYEKRDWRTAGWPVDEAGRAKSTGNPIQNARPQAPANGRNIRSVWTVATQPYPGAHFATFPPKLIEPCIKAGCPPNGVVLDPFAGSGTTGMVAQSFSRRAVLIDLNIDYLDQLMDRNAAIPLGLGEAS